jgi:type IV secretory pathway VirB2 component (pilin)
MKFKFLRALATKENLKTIAVAAIGGVPLVASAAISFPAIDGIGCDIVNWIKGPLAVIVFLIVAVVTFVVGMFAKMDWTKILTIVILYGVIQGLAGLATSSGYITLPGCFTA